MIRAAGQRGMPGTELIGVFEKNGWFFNPGDSLDLSEKITQIVNEGCNLREI